MAQPTVAEEVGADGVAVAVSVGEGVAESVA
jgi:hypothetical protein